MPRLPIPAHSRNSELRARSSQKASLPLCRATVSTIAVSVTISTTASTARAAQKSGKLGAGVRAGRTGRSARFRAGKQCRCQAIDRRDISSP